MKLELDLGNSFVKWRLTDASDVISRGRKSISDLELFADELGNCVPDTVYISSVAGDHIDHQLDYFCRSRWSVKPLFAQVSEVASVPLVSAYRSPAQMGVDRWLAMLSARATLEGSLVVVDVGSAITIDKVDSGYNHQGGYILPGYRMLQSALLGDTARVRFDPAEKGDIAGGASTAECVASGAELVLRGLALQLLERVNHNVESKIVLTGGDADRLKPYIADRACIVERAELVLDGLSYAKMELI